MLNYVPTFKSGRYLECGPGSRVIIRIRKDEDRGSCTICLVKANPLYKSGRAMCAIERKMERVHDCLPAGLWLAAYVV